MRFLLQPRPEWFDDAACLGSGPDRFYPDNGRPPTGRDDCESCMVQQQCRAYGMDEAHGLWGGLTVSERDDVRGHRLKLGPRRPALTR